MAVIHSHIRRNASARRHADAVRSVRDGARQQAEAVLQMLIEAGAPEALLAEQRQRVAACDPREPNA